MTDDQTKPEGLTEEQKATREALVRLGWVIPADNRPGESPYYTAREAAAYLRIAYGTFRNWATQIKRNNLGRYHRADLDRFANTRKRPKRAG